MPTLCRVQWTGEEKAWEAICDLHADSDLVAFRESNGTVSIETSDGRRVSARVGDWVVKNNKGFYILSTCMSCGRPADAQHEESHERIARTAQPT
jgi:hypothetical protein